MVRIRLRRARSSAVGLRLDFRIVLLVRSLFCVEQTLHSTRVKLVGAGWLVGSLVCWLGCWVLSYANNGDDDYDETRSNDFLKFSNHYNCVVLGSRTPHALFGEYKTKICSQRWSTRISEIRFQLPAIPTTATTTSTTTTTMASTTTARRSHPASTLRCHLARIPTPDSSRQTDLFSVCVWLAGW